MQEPGDDPWHISRYVDTDDVSKRLAETLDLSEQEHEESDADESQKTVPNLANGALPIYYSAGLMVPSALTPIFHAKYGEALLRHVKARAGDDAVPIPFEVAQMWETAEAMEQPAFAKRGLGCKMWCFVCFSGFEEKQTRAHMVIDHELQARVPIGPGTFTVIPAKGCYPSLGSADISVDGAEPWVRLRRIHGKTEVKGIGAVSVVVSYFMCGPKGLDEVTPLPKSVVMYSLLDGKPAEPARRDTRSPYWYFTMVPSITALEELPAAANLLKSFRAPNGFDSVAMETIKRTYGKTAELTDWNTMMAYISERSDPQDPAPRGWCYLLFVTRGQAVGRNVFVLHATKSMMEIRNGESLIVRASECPPWALSGSLGRHPSDIQPGVELISEAGNLDAFFFYFFADSPQGKNLEYL